MHACTEKLVSNKKLRIGKRERRGRERETQHQNASEHRENANETAESKKLSQALEKMVVEDAPKTSALEDQAKTETNPKSVQDENEPEEGEIVGDDDSSASSKISKGLTPQHHPLEHSWTFWFDSATAKPAKSKQEDWGSSIRPIYTFSTVEEFWGSVILSVFSLRFLCSFGLGLFS